MTSTCKLTRNSLTVSEVDDLLYFELLEDCLPFKAGEIGFNDRSSTTFMGGSSQYAGFNGDLADTKCRILQPGDSFTVTIEDE